jgi:hypothetical protein
MSKKCRLCDQRTVKVLGVSAFLLSLALLVTPMIMPICQGLLETKTGMMVPMRCHWSYKIEQVIAILSLAVAGLYFLIKNTEARKYFGLAFSVLGLLAILVPTDLIIGVCRSAEMACRHTTAWMWGWAGLLILNGLGIMLVNSQMGKAEKQ